MGVRRLEVGMVGFLPSCDGVGLRVGGGVDGAESGDGGGGKERVGGAWAECWDVREERAKRKRDAVRMGVKILHDFLHGLAPGLEGVEFEWLDRTGSDPSRDTHSGTLRTPSSSSSGGSGSSAALPSSSAFPTPSSASTAPLSSSAASTAPCSLPSSPSSPSRSAHPNPLLLDLEVPRLFPPSRFAASAGDGSTAAAGPPGGPITKWFTAPPILWPRLREVRLGGVGMAGEDVRRLKGRAKGLESVWVGVGYWEGGEVGEGVGGKGHGGVKWWNREWAREDGDVEGGVGRGVRLRRGFGVEGGGGGGRGIGEEGGWVRIDVRGVEGVPVEVDRMKIGGRSRGGSSGFDGAGGGGERKGGSSRSTTRHLFEGAKEERKAGKEAEGKVRKEGGSGAEKEVEVSQEDATRQDSELELEDCNIGHGVESMVLTFILDTGPGA